MKTRAATRTAWIREQEQQREEEVKAAETERLRIASDHWILEGRVINPAVPKPSKESIEKWKTFIISANNHPNILVHQDVQCIRDLFQFFGTYITYETCNLLVELGVSNDSSLHCLQPYSPYVGHQLVLGKIAHFEFLPYLNAVLVRAYSLMEDLKTELAALVELIIFYPEVLLYPNFNFLYDFLIKFGVSSDAITTEIFQTQLRRASAKIPASTILLKLGVPEVIEVNSGICDKELKETQPCIHKIDVDARFAANREMGLSCRQSNSSSEEDSGIDIGNIDQQDSSSTTSGIDTEVKDSRRLIKIEQTENYNIRKPFKCTVCERRYAFKGNCNWHIRQRHPNAALLPGKRRHSTSATDGLMKSLRCPFCNKMFVTLKSLQLHITKHHPDSSKISPRKNVFALSIKHSSSMNRLKRYRKSKCTPSSNHSLLLPRKTLHFKKTKTQSQFAVNPGLQDDNSESTASNSDWDLSVSSQKSISSIFSPVDNLRFVPIENF